MGRSLLVDELGGVAAPGLDDDVAGVGDVAAGARHEALASRELAAGIDLFLATLGEEGRRVAFSLAEKLRHSGISVDLDHRGRALRKQLSLANNLHARHLLVIGDDEATSKVGKIKHMDSGEETEIPLETESIVDFLRKGV